MNRVPFTPSHAAAALLFTRTPLVPSALVIGTMAPDLPYFVPGGPSRELTHSIVGGLTVDVAIALVAIAAWQVVFRAPASDFLPSRVRARLPTRQPWRPTLDRSFVSAVVLAAVSAVVGIATHLAWDSFTHGGWLSARVPILDASVGPLQLFALLQYVSSIGGILALAAWAVIWMRRTEPVHSVQTRLTRRARAVGWVAVLVVGVLVVVAVVVITSIRGGPIDAPHLLFAVATRSIAASGAVVVAACLVWHVLPRRMDYV